MTVSEQGRKVGEERVYFRVKGSSEYHKEVLDFLEKKVESLKKQIEVKYGD